MNRFYFQPENSMFYSYLTYEQSYQLFHPYSNNIFLPNIPLPLQPIINSSQNHPISSIQQDINHIQNNTMQEQTFKLAHKNLTFSQKKINKSNCKKNINQTSQKRNLVKNPHQKQNRNVFSNIFRNFFRRLKDFSKFIDIVDTIIKQRELNLKTQQFFQYVRSLKIDHSTYIRLRYVKDLFSNRQFAEQNLILRIVFNHYIQNEGLIQTLTSHKIGGWSLLNHLKGLRELNTKLYQQQEL